MIDLLDPGPGNQMELGVRGPRPAGPPLHDGAVVVDGGGGQDVGDRQRSAICRDGGPRELRSAAEPALDRIVELILSGAVLDGDAHTREVRRQRCRRLAVSVRVLQRIRVDDQASPPGEPDIAILADGLVVEHRLAAVGPAFDRQAASIAAIHVGVHRCDDTAREGSGPSGDVLPCAT